MTTAICRAKDPTTCHYHGAVIRMLHAQSIKDLDGYFEARSIVEQAEKDNWVETEIANKETTPKEYEIKNAVKVKSTRNNKEKVFFRRRPGVLPGKPEYIRIQTDHKLSQDEVIHLARLVGYQYTSTIHGRKISAPYQDSENSFMVGVDVTTSTRADNLDEAFTDFENGLDKRIQDGSDIRKTDKQGEGTKGTRAIGGYPEPIKLEIYYDNVQAAETEKEVDNR